MSSDPSILLASVSKAYPLFSHPGRHLLHLLPVVGRWVQPTKQHHALSEVSLTVRRGECLGLIGRNGAGKSTLLQLVAGIIQPSSGTVSVSGRVAALLELGAGFNPRFTGRENIMLNGVLLGLSQTEVQSHLDDIIEFSELGEKIDQPVSTYSSGMFVRLAFSVATAVMPDVLIIDEALSVGDGAFAKKSFDRIMAMKDQGVTILFCSHATYHVDTICDRALWIDQGTVQALGPTADVLDAYNEFLLEAERDASQTSSQASDLSGGRLVRVDVREPAIENHQSGAPYILQSGVTDVVITIEGYVPVTAASPHVGVVINDSSGHNVTSCGTHVDQVTVQRDAEGCFKLDCTLMAIPLLRGLYTVHVFLLCERGIHIYDTRQVATFKITQDDPSLGLVRIPHHWSSP